VLSHMHSLSGLQSHGRGRIWPVKLRHVTAN
jgi:hypothetical protein